MLTIRDVNEELPQEIHVYHSLRLLDHHSEKMMGPFGMTSVYRAIRANDGQMYVLRRLEGKLVGARV